MSILKVALTKYHWDYGDSVKAADDISKKVPTGMTGEVILYFPYEDHHGNRFPPEDEMRRNIFKRNPNSPLSKTAPKDGDYMFQFMLLPDKENWDYYFISWDSQPEKPQWVPAHDLNSLEEGERRLTPEEAKELIVSRETPKEKKEKEPKRILPMKAPGADLVRAQPGDIVGIGGSGSYHWKFKYIKGLPGNKCLVVPLGEEETEENAVMIDMSEIKMIYDPNVETATPARTWWPTIRGKLDKQEDNMDKIDKKAVDNFAKAYWNKVLTEMSSKDKIAKLMVGAKVEVIPTGAIGEIVKAAGGKPPKFDVRLGDGKVYRIIFSCLGVPTTKGKSKKKILSWVGDGYKELDKSQQDDVVYDIAGDKRRQEEDAASKARYQQLSDVDSQRTHELEMEKAKHPGKRITSWLLDKEASRVEPVKAVEEKKALDQYAKSYWSQYLKSTGYGEHLLRVAMNKMAEVLKQEDKMTPMQMDAAYNKISSEFKDKGGDDLLRVARMEAIRQLLRESNMGSVIFKKTDEDDKALREAGMAPHYYGDIGFLHLRNKEDFNKVKEHLASNEPDYYIPGDWQ